MRTTINIADDVHPDHSDAVKARMKELRRPSFSNYVENLIADDVKANGAALLSNGAVATA